MIAFRCSRCFKINICLEGHGCMHCGYEAQAPSVPENQTEIKSISTINNDVYSSIQNKYAGCHLGVFSRASEELKAKLPEIDEKDTKTLNSNIRRISLPQEEKVGLAAQNFISKEVLISTCPTACSNGFFSTGDGKNCSLRKCGASAPTKKLQHISEQSSLDQSKDNPKVKKSIPNENVVKKPKRKDSKSTQNEDEVGKMNLGSLRSFSSEESMLGSVAKDCIGVNKPTNNRRKSNHDKLSRERRNSTTDNGLQDDLKIANAFPEHSTDFSREVSSKGCTSDSSEKLPISRIKTPVSKEIFLCDECGKTFADESKLKAHFMNHLKEKPFKCDRCSKEYSSVAHLERHHRSHFDKGPFKCEFCDLVFIRHCHLSRHHKKHILEPTVDVNTAEQQMGRSFQQREQESSDDDDLQKHSQIATEENIFLCTECGVKFIRESDFHAHSLRHDAQKPFKCKKCNKEFRYECYLNRHYRVHSLERPFACKICGFSSTQESNLNKHLKIHHKI